MDQGAQVSLTMAKSDRQKHLKQGLTIHSTRGWPYLLGAPKPSKKETEEEQQEQQKEQQEEEQAPVPTNHKETEAEVNLDDDATAREATTFNDINDLEKFGAVPTVLNNWYWKNEQ